MRNAIYAMILMVLFLIVPAAVAAPPTRVMLLDGESGGPYHAWQETTPYLKRMLDDTGIFQTDVVTAPPRGGDFTNFKPDWSKYQVIVLNYDAPDERWSADLKASFEKYVRDGGGLVIVHAADNAFPNWREFNLMIGIGGWRGRNEKSGPHFYYKEGKLVADASPGSAGTHGARLPIKMVNIVTDHPITKGLPKEWMHTADELYARMRGPGENMTVLSTAYSDPTNKGTGCDEPMLIVLSYGKGRVFHTLLGHDLTALNSVGFIVTYQRGTEWAATGNVTQKIPNDFPTADKTSTRKDYDPPPGWGTAAAAPAGGRGRGQGGASGQPAYLNPALPIDQRVDDVVSRMTMEEKAGQLVNTTPAIPRLGIPAYNWWSEAAHGVVTRDVTVFPQVIGQAATFDSPLIKEMATAISTEARARFHELQRQPATGGAAPFGRALGLDFWAPNINIVRDPRWGRGQETYGEDPFLTGRMAVAYVTGMQGDDPRYFRTIATPKHFAVHSGPESTRHSVDVKVSLHDMEDTYLPAFRAAVVEGKADSVMCAYNRINGEPACVNTFLLEDTLRGAWKFNGYVVSDCGAITDIWRGHKFVPTMPEAAAFSLKKGTDNDCGGGDAPAYLEAMQKQLITQKEVDVNLKRLFKARFQLGLFDPPEMVKYAQIPAAEADSEAHRQLALKVSRETMVLLKNDGVLPLKSSVRNIAVVGPIADSLVALEGNYNGTPSRYTTVLDGIRKQFASAKVTYNPGTKFLRFPVTIPASAYHTTDGKPGLTAVYFNNKDLSGTPVATRTEAQLGFGGPGFGAAPGGRGVSVLPAEVGAEFSAQWTGAITPQQSGKYELTINGAGGIRVWLDGKAVIDDWTSRPQGRFGAPPDPAVARLRTAEVSLEAGKNYDLKVEFFRTPPAPQAANPAAPAGAFGGGRGGFGPTGPTLQWNLLNDVSDAVAAAKQADIVVAVVGITSQLEGEEGAGRGMQIEGFSNGDRTNINLPKDEESLLQAVKATGKPLVVVLMNGSALAVNWASKNANAILESWYPGEEGGAAVAETLAGVNNPAGRLPVTFYKSTDDLPPFDDYSMKGRTYRYFDGRPLFPFGYGLSYSKFAYSNVKLSSSTVNADAGLKVDADIRNTSRITGDEVVQLYLIFPNLPGAPIRSLRGFQRMSIAPGQTQHVQFTLDPRDLSYVNEAGERVVASGSYRIFVGGGQPGAGAAGMEARLSITGETKLDR